MLNMKYRKTQKRKSWGENSNKGNCWRGKTGGS